MAFCKANHQKRELDNEDEISVKTIKNINACCEIWVDGSIWEIPDYGKRLYTRSQRSLIGWVYQHKWKGLEGWQKE